jgi:glycosyltransferase involved in cell wall biosynthesis
VARVVFITTSYPSWLGDPSGHFVELEARERARRGDDVVVLAPGTRSTRGYGVTLVGLPGASAFGWPGAIERLRERPYRALSACAFVTSACLLLRSLGKFDEIVAHWILPSGFPIACSGDGPIEVVLHGSDVRLFTQLPRAARAGIARSLLERGARFRFVSSELRDAFVSATTPEVLTRSSVNPCLLDTTGVAPRAEARRRFGIAPTENVAVVVGRLVADKRPLDAARMALERGADRVVVVGDGPLRSAVETMDSRVIGVGMQAHPDTLAWIGAADVLISASRIEGSPTAIREARALGVPVVATRCGDVAEWARSDPGIELVE